MSNARKIADLLDSSGDVLLTNLDNTSLYVKPSSEPINYITGLQTALDTKTTPGYVDSAVAGIVDSAPATLNTLNELALALGDDANYASTITTALAGKVDDGQVLTNVPTGALFTDTVYSHPANHTISEVSGLQSALDAKTTESYVDAEITTLIGAAPAALNTLQELGDALGDDANYASTITTALAGKVDDGQVLTNVPSGAVFTDTVYSHPSTHAISEVSGLQTELDTKITDTLSAYNNTAAITGNAVDIFIYDTSKDSDGGAWRKRTQDTSWYNETLNTATRGSRKDFPAVAVIVAESNKVTIYDGDTPDLDMWMVFEDGAYKIIRNPCTLTAVSADNAIISFTDNGNAAGAYTVNFLSEKTDRYGSGNHKIHAKEIIGRNDTTPTNWSGGNFSSTGIVNWYCNDVAMTVLPNAPIDSATGLPTPTIAVATNGGVSVIKDDGTVVDYTWSTDDFGSVAFWKNELIIGHDDGDSWYSLDVPTSDTTYYVADHNNFYRRNTIPTLLHPGTGTRTQVLGNSAGTQSGVTLFKHDNSQRHGIGNSGNSSNGSVAYITSKYNTGYMTGDIRGAWNVDTDVTTLGTNIVTNGDFSAGTASWSGFGSGWTESGGKATATSGAGYITQDGILTTGKQYSITLDLTSPTSGGIYIYCGTGAPSGVYYTNVSTAGTHTVVLTAFNANLGFYVPSGWGGTIDNISVKEAIPDRSVKGNGLAVYGTPTVSAVATGAELKCLSGFTSTAGYTTNGTRLEQPYNSDYDFTGDWDISLWVKGSAGDIEIWWADAAGDNGWMIYHNVSTSYFIDGNWSGYSVYLQTNDTTSLKGSWTKVNYVCRSGTLYYYLNGRIVTSGTATKDISSWTLTNTSAHKLAFYNNSSSTATKYSLFKISATAPTAEQIKEIYEAEKPLFQANSSVTLSGSSDAVTAMSYDDSNEELLVGTSGGLSVFKGLRRVDENTNNITEVAQQGSLRVEEY